MSGGPPAPGVSTPPTPAPVIAISTSPPTASDKPRRSDSPPSSPQKPKAPISNPPSRPPPANPLGFRAPKLTDPNLFLASMEKAPTQLLTNSALTEQLKKVAAAASPTASDGKINPLLAKSSSPTFRPTPPGGSAPPAPKSTAPPRPEGGSSGGTTMNGHGGSRTSGGPTSGPVGGISTRSPTDELSPTFPAASSPKTTTFTEPIVRTRRGTSEGPEGEKNSPTPATRTLATSVSSSDKFGSGPPPAPDVDSSTGWVTDSTDKSWEAKYHLQRGLNRDLRNKIDELKKVLQDEQGNTANSEKKLDKIKKAATNQLQKLKQENVNLAKELKKEQVNKQFLEKALESEETSKQFLQKELANRDEELKQERSKREELEEENRELQDKYNKLVEAVKRGGDNQYRAKYEEEKNSRDQMEKKLSAALAQLQQQQKEYQQLLLQPVSPPPPPLDVHAVSAPPPSATTPFGQKPKSPIPSSTSSTGSGIFSASSTASSSNPPTSPIIQISPPPPPKDPLPLPPPPPVEGEKEKKVPPPLPPQYVTPTPPSGPPPLPTQHATPPPLPPQHGMPPSLLPPPPKTVDLRPPPIQLSTRQSGALPRGSKRRLDKRKSRISSAGLGGPVEDIPPPKITAMMFDAPTEAEVAAVEEAAKDDSDDEGDLPVPPPMDDKDDFQIPASGEFEQDSPRRPAGLPSSPDVADVASPLSPTHSPPNSPHPSGLAKELKELEELSPLGSDEPSSSSSSASISASSPVASSPFLSTSPKGDSPVSSPSLPSPLASSSTNLDALALIQAQDEEKKKKKEQKRIDKEMRESSREEKPVDRGAVSKDTVLERWKRKWNLVKAEAQMQYMEKSLQEVLTNYPDDAARWKQIDSLEESFNKLEYFLLKQIGSGGFGNVYKGIRRRDGLIVAIKIIDLEDSADDIMTISREIAALTNGQLCGQLVSYYGSCVDRTKLWIAMEYLDGGSVMDHIKKSCFKEKHIAIVCREVLLGLYYLSKEGKIHRDIKAANVLLSRSGLVKLADFGASRSLTDTMTKCKTFVGSPYWMAPEVMTQSDYDGKADIWSLGITCYEMATGKPPYAGQPHLKVMELITREKPPTLQGDFSKSMKDFMKWCLMKDPAKRPPVHIMLKHSFIKKAKPNNKLKELFK